MTKIRTGHGACIVSSAPRINSPLSLTFASHVFPLLLSCHFPPLISINYFFYFISFYLFFIYGQKNFNGCAGGFLRNHSIKSLILISTRWTCADQFVNSHPSLLVVSFFELPKNMNKITIINIKHGINQNKLIPSTHSF